MQSDAINIDGRSVEVPTTPIGAGATLSTFLPPRAVVAEDRLILELDRGMRLLGFLFIAWGLTFATIGVLAHLYRWPTEAIIVGLVPGAVCPLVGLFMILFARRCVFDRRSAEYRRQSLIASTVRPLSDIVAVQAIRGRMVETHDDGTAWRRQTYELNLVITGGKERLSVTCTANNAWVVEAGQAVSTFLKLPFLCQMADNAQDPGAS